MGNHTLLHPTEQTLSDFSLGKLDDIKAEVINNHLNECADCQRLVAEMSSDSFLGRLQGVRGRLDTGPALSSSLAGLSRIAGEPGSAEPPPASSLPPGLADHPDYEVVRELGQGGMGTVYLAQNRLMGRNEVLKVVSSHLIKRRGVLDRFQVEIRNAARLHHTNIVTAYSASRLGESIIFAMEYVEGLDLSQLVKTKGPLPVANACNYAHQACLGLQHAHEHGMVHRDIKPSNLMLSRQGKRAVIKVLDFGLAKIQSEGPVDGGLTHEGQMLGTPDYIAPEQIRDARGSDIRADIYSLGCTLYYLLTGGPPFQATSLYDLLQAHHSMDAMPLNLARPEVPVELAAIVAKMMAKEPERRFQEPKEVAQALTPFFTKGDVAFKSPESEVSHAGESSSGRPVPGAVSTPTQPATNDLGRVAHQKRVATPSAPETEWKSLIDLRETGPSRDETPAIAPTRRAPWLRPALVVGVLLLAFAAAWGVIIKIRTPEGFIVLKDLPDQATVLINEKKATVRWPDGGGPAEIAVAPGDYMVQVKKDGFTMKGQTVRVDRDGKTLLIVELEPLDTSPPKKGDDDPVRSAVGEPPAPPAIGAVGTTSPTPPPTRAADPSANPTVFAEANPWPEALTLKGQKIPLNAGIRAMSRDGRLLAQKSPAIPLRIFRSPDAVNHVDSELTAGIRGAAFSPDGKYLASYGDHLSVKFVRFWDTTSGKEVRQIPQGGRVVSVAFSPDGTRLAAVTHNNHTITVWDATTGELQRTLTGHTDCPWFAEFSPDGTRLATCSGPWDEWKQSPGEVKVWDVRTGAFTNLTGHTMRASSVAFSPDGRYLVSAGFDQMAKVWDLKTLQCVTTFDKHKGYVVGARFSPDGRLVASIAREIPVRVWEAATGREVDVLTGHPGNPGWVAFSPGGRWIFAGSGNTLKAWAAPASLGPQTSDFAGPSITSSRTSVAVPRGTGGSPIKAVESPTQPLSLKPPGSSDQVAGREPDKSFRLVFNNKDFSGWTAFLNSKEVDPHEVARVSEGDLVMVPGRDGGELRTERSYKGFILKLEYMFPIGGILTPPGSGVSILHRSGDGLSYKQERIECQVRPGESGDFYTSGVASLLGEDRRGRPDRLGRKFDAELPPGKWNKVLIHAEGSRIEYELNGKRVNWADSSQPISGWICLMNQGSDVRFRNIEVKDLFDARGPTKKTPARKRLGQNGGAPESRATTGPRRVVTPESGDPRRWAASSLVLDEVALIPANKEFAYKLSAIRKDDKLVLQYISGKWKGWGKYATESPDSEVSQRGDRCRLAICEVLGQVHTRVLFVVPPRTENKPFEWVADKDYPMIVLRMNDDDNDFDSNPNAGVRYQVRLLTTVGRPPQRR